LPAKVLSKNDPQVKQMDIFWTFADPEYMLDVFNLFLLKKSKNTFFTQNSQKVEKNTNIFFCLTK
jgi:hypothetical protein